MGELYKEENPNNILCSNSSFLFNTVETFLLLLFWIVLFLLPEPHFSKICYGYLITSLIQGYTSQVRHGVCHILVALLI